MFFGSSTTRHRVSSRVVRVACRAISPDKVAGCVGTSEVDAGLVLVTVHTPAIPGLRSPTEIQARGVLPGRRQKQPAASERGGLLNS